MALLSEIEHYQDFIRLRESWRGRALRTASHKTFAVLLSVLADSYDDEMYFLLRAVFPGFTSIQPPFLISSGRVAKSGRVIAKCVDKSGTIFWAKLYRNEVELRDDFRKLADKLQMDDIERQEMFAAIRRWVVADFRLDPNMDPMDPDAKRLVH